MRALYSGISRGTESLVFRGEVPESQHEAMRAPFQEGSFPAPVKYGYSSVGEVVEGPEELVGHRVFCLFPHQDVYCVPAEAALRLPAGLPTGRAVLAANMETALNALWDGQPRAGGRVVVIGAGAVGLLVAFLCADQASAEVLVYDIDPARAGTAAELGLAFTAETPAGADADLVVHASGTGEGLRTALDTAGMEATILELSWYGTRSVALPLGEAFHSRRLTLKSSQVGRIPPHMSADWDHRRRLAKALELLTEPRLDALITGESDFDDLPTTLAELSLGARDALCHRIRYP